MQKQHAIHLSVSITEVSEHSHTPRHMERGESTDIMWPAKPKILPGWPFTE